MRIGIFGGTFDPVHLAHLILAEQCREQGRLDQVWFIPAARPPHKPQRVLTPLAQRVEMLALAVAGQPTFRIDDLEKDRPGPSYTADTLTELHQRHLRDEFFLLMGSDMLADLPSWHQPARVVELATLLVVARPDWQMKDLDALGHALGSAPGTSLRHQVIRMPLLEISSSDLRQRVATGRSLRYLVPRAVEEYIREKKLYVASGGRQPPV